jgi:hypothetical protein
MLLHDPSASALQRQRDLRLQNQITDLTLDQWINKLANWQIALIRIRTHNPTCCGRNFVSSGPQTYGKAFTEVAQFRALLASLSVHAQLKKVWSDLPQLESQSVRCEDTCLLTILDAISCLGICVSCAPLATRRASDICRRCVIRLVGGL